MAFESGFIRGVDVPSWHWLAYLPAPASGTGTANVYDGHRYLYFALTVGAGSQLWRFCTWTGGWQMLAELGAGGAGLDLALDGTRGLLYVLHGAGLTTWEVFNVSRAAATRAGVTCAPMAAFPLPALLPAPAGRGASLSIPGDAGVPDVLEAGTAATSPNPAQVLAAAEPRHPNGRFGPGLIGCQLRVLSGPLAGQRRVIVAADGRTLTLSVALPGTLAAGDAFVVELPQGGVSFAGNSTLTQENAGWAANAYAGSDVLIVTGTGAGQRRRVASNTPDTLSLAAGVLGASRTGPWTTAPDASSTFRIVPCADFAYYQPGEGSAALYRLDLSAATPSWTTLTNAPGGVAGGGGVFFAPDVAPFVLLSVRGGDTAQAQRYHIGLGIWTALDTYWGAERVGLGASVTPAAGVRKLVVQKAGSARVYAHDLITGELEPLGVMPYADPHALDGRRARVVRTPEGVTWLYVLRAGGQEFFRVPLEWL